ncbi:MAG: phosphatase PAP2 family protein [Ktedonobacterales bacterium]
MTMENIEHHDNSPDQIEDIQARVAADEYPRWRVLRRGHVWLSVYVVALIAVTALALAAHAMSVLPGDLPLTRELQEHRNPLIFWLLYSASWIGFSVQSVVIPVIAVSLLLLFRLRLEALFTAIAVVGASLLNTLLKAIVGRQRPASDLVHVVQQLNSPSFPSGHVMHYTVFYGFLIFIIATNFRSSWGRNLLLGILIALIVLVGPSRVYLGEHWPTDVLGAYIIGGLCLVPLIWGYLRAKARLRTHA